MVTPIDYIRLIWGNKDLFRAKSDDGLNEPKSRLDISKFKTITRFLRNSLIGAFDFLKLLSILFFIKLLKKNKIKLFFLSKNFFHNDGKKNSLRLGEDLITSSTILINTSKDFYIKRINGCKVYNIGLLVKAASLIYYFEHDKISKFFKSYNLVNSFLLILNSAIDEIYFFFYYDLNSFSLIFSKFRNKLKLIEIQHGSMINFPPYMEPSPVKVADVFYVRNVSTIEYLKSNLCRNFASEYRLLVKPKVNKVHKTGMSILYASTIEFGGFHPVFKEFLKGFKQAFPSQILNLRIRLHPRERGREDLFLADLNAFMGNFEFDNSDNWLLSNSIEGLTVISPWSSIIEEACDNHFKVITIDEIGKSRYSYLSDNLYFSYSDDLISFFKKLE